MWEFYCSLMPSMLLSFKLTLSVVFIYFIFNFLYITNKWAKREATGFYGWDGKEDCGFYEFAKEDDIGLFLIGNPVLIIMVIFGSCFVWPLLIVIGIWIAIAFKIRSMHDNKIIPWTPKDHIWDDIAHHLSDPQPTKNIIPELLDKIDTEIDRRQSND